MNFPIKPPGIDFMLKGIDVVIFMLKDCKHVGIGTEVPRKDGGSLMLIDLLLV